METTFYEVAGFRLTKFLTHIGILLGFCQILQSNYFYKQAQIVALEAI